MEEVVLGCCRIDPGEVDMSYPVGDGQGAGGPKRVALGVLGVEMRKLRAASPPFVSPPRTWDARWGIASSM